MMASHLHQESIVKPLLASLLLLGIACAAPQHPGRRDALHIDPPSATLRVNEVLTFKVIGLAPLSGKRFTWSADRGSVSPEGVYTAPSTPGPDRVRAKYTASTQETFTAAITVVR